MQLLKASDETLLIYFLRRLRKLLAARLTVSFSATLSVAENRGADFVKYLVPSRFARQNKVLDRTP